MIAERLAQPAWLFAIAAAPAVMLLWTLASFARRASLRRFGTLTNDPASVVRRWFKAVLVATAAGMIALGLARPRMNPTPRETERLGRDVVFVVDVSRSMLARDIAPNRLERTKLWIKDLIASLDGDRVGLVAFAGAATVQCPLTLDRSFLRLALDRLNTDSAPRGGTNIGDAIRKTIDNVFSLDDEEEREGDAAAPPRYRDIVLITDGEDQESFPIEAARQAGERGVRIIAIGIGSEGDGATIPESGSTSSLLRFSGEVVRSKLDTATLEAIAAASPGNVFLNVGTATTDLEAVYRDLIGAAEQTATGSAVVIDYDEYFWAFLIGAGLLLGIEPLIREVRKQ